MHETLATGLPVLAVLVGILLNQRGLDKLETRIDAGLGKLEGRMDRMQADLSQFYRILGEHGTKIDILMEERDKRQS